MLKGQTVHLIIDPIYDVEYSPRIKVYANEADAIAEEKRLIADGSYLVARDWAVIE